MNWGWKIVFLYGAFVALILTLVFKSMNQRVDLVRNDYYNEELKYQDRIDSRSNSTTLSTPVRSFYENGKVKLVFPPEMKNSKIGGTVLFYRPSDSNLDIRMALSPDTSGTQAFSAPFKTGLYSVQLEWVAAGKNYFSESSITIP